MTCSVEGCEREVKYKGMCGMHYKRYWRHGNPQVTFTIADPQRYKQCIVDDCDNVVGEHGAKGYCAAHYNRFYKYERLHRVIAPKGSGTIDSNGYRVYSDNNVKILEHRLLATMALGRPLPPGVVVHHMNGIKDDNYTPLNLVVCPDQAYHMLIEQRTREYNRKVTTIKADE